MKGKKVKGRENSRERKGTKKEKGKKENEWDGLSRGKNYECCEVEKGIKKEECILRKGGCIVFVYCFNISVL